MYFMKCCLWLEVINQ